MTDKSDDDVDWSLATWEGAQRESLRRWAKLPLENIIAALEEMQALNDALHPPDAVAVKEPETGYGNAEKHSPINRKK